jgi:hypothetical protein
MAGYPAFFAAFFSEHLVRIPLTGLQLDYRIKESITKDPSNDTDKRKNNGF